MPGRARASQHLSLLSEKRPVDANCLLGIGLEVRDFFLLKMDEKWISCMLSFANQDV